MKQTVTASALLQRVNRKLTKQDWPQKVCKLSPTARGYNDLGEYHVIDVNKNTVVQSHVNLEDFARELGVMHETEVSES